MKRLMRNWMAIGMLGLTLSAAIAPAQNTTEAGKSEKICMGIVTSVEPTQHRFSIMQTWHIFHKHFTVGTNCLYTTLDKNSDKIYDLRPGENIMVRFQRAHGRLIALRVEQQPIEFEGTLSQIDQQKKTFTLHQPTMDKDFRITDDCMVLFEGSKPGKFSDLKIGTHLTATYEIPENEPVAHQIVQSSIVFTGKLTAIDLKDHTLKAKAAFESKQFHLGKNCAILLTQRNNSQRGQLADLKLNEKLAFSYDCINGEDVVSRIVPARVLSSTAGVTGSLPE